MMEPVTVQDPKAGIKIHPSSEKESTALSSQTPSPPEQWFSSISWEYWPFSLLTYSESQKYTPTQAFSLNIRTLPFSPSLSAENPLSVTQTIQSAANAHPLLGKAGVDSNWDIFGPFGPFETPSTKKHHSDHQKYPVWSFKAQTQRFQGEFLTAGMLFPWDCNHYCQLLWRQFLLKQGFLCKWQKETNKSTSRAPRLWSNEQIQE